MKNIIFIVITLLNCFIWNQESIAQNKEYLVSLKYLENVNEAIEQGDLTTAKTKIYQSLDNYPVVEVFGNIEKVFQLPDIKTGMEMMDYLLSKVESFPKKKILVNNNYSYDKHSKLFQEVDKDRAAIYFYELQFGLLKRYGNKKDIVQELEKSIQIQIEHKKNKFGMDMEHMKLQSLKLNYYSYINDKVKVNETLNQLFSGIAMGQNPILKETIEFNDYLELEDYENATKLAEKYKNVDLKKEPHMKGLYETKMFSIYSKQGNDLTPAFYEKVINNYGLDFGKTWSHGKLALANYYKKKGEYKKALELLEEVISLNKRTSLDYMLIDNWILFNDLGETYAGMLEFDKAKTAYETALMYDPEYEKAIQGLAQLESKVAGIQSTDKLGPEIQIIQPAVRGLKITGSDKLLIKGRAIDPSGISEVSINGTKVYLTDAGDFWAEMPAKSGINKYLITAKDKSNNLGTKELEFELNIAQKEDDLVPVIANSGKNYCLLIASQNYKDSSIPSLNNPIMDAVKLKILLKNNYGFSEDNIIPLYNPTVNELQRQLKELTLTLKEEDNLLIFYAGHGIWKEQEKKGYWLMSDSRYADVSTWLPNKAVLEEISNIPSRHILLITDACFSGSVFKTRGLSEAPTAIKEMENKITRVAITSGNDTEVPDESVFMKYLIKALSENKESYLMAQKMFINHVLEAVMTETKTEPRYGTLEMAGHIGGDFIFIKK